MNIVKQALLSEGSDDKIINDSINYCDEEYIRDCLNYYLSFQELNGWSFAGLNYEDDDDFETTSLIKIQNLFINFEKQCVTEEFSYYVKNFNGLGLDVSVDAFNQPCSLPNSGRYYTNGEASLFLYKLKAGFDMMIQVRSNTDYIKYLITDP